jgi:N-methylhydantoinase B
MKGRLQVRTTEFQKSVVDPVTLSVVWNRLLSITRDVGERVVHSAQSFVMANARDLGPILIDDRGRVITQVDFATAHCLVAEVPTRKILDKFEGKLYSGDCVLANDGHIIKSGHLPDWTFFAPIFWHDKLVFYCHFRGHMMDTGGAYSGGYFPRAYDCIAEGLNIPPLKIMERGQECKEVLELLFRNVRNSPGVYTDSMLIYGSIMKAQEDVCSLIDKYGLDTVRDCCKEMIRAGEEAMRREIEKIPEGVYTGETAVDWDGTTPNKPVWIRVKLTVKGDEMTFDFSGSQEQVDFVNSPIGNTRCFTYAAVFLTMDPGMPHNQGSMNPIHIIAPEGTVVNPTYPHTYGSCALNCGTQIAEVCLEALGKAIPERAVAPWARHLCPFMVGRDPRPEMMYDPRTKSVREYFGGPFASMPGSGAVKGYDGWEGVGFLSSGGVMVRGSIEKAEIFYPFYWRRVELSQDTEGPGEFTGCTGTYMELVCESKEGFPAIVMTGNSDGEVIAPKGVAGAPPAQLHQMYVYRAARKTKEILRTVDMTTVGPGDVVITKAAGGAGWGRPLDRDVERVKEDVKEGVVSVQRAKDTYGVIIDSETFAIDYEATNELRGLMKKSNPPSHQ